MDISLRCFRALERFDAINALDPRLELGRPKELVYAERMSAWLGRLDPDASEVLQLAARSQHIKRWEIARTDYPEGPIGYKQWRKALTELHAQVSSSVLEEEGYDAATITRVVSLFRKERLKLDAESQMLEDVVCLVFLENYFLDFSAKHDPEMVVSILRKTWKKMSDKAKMHALQLQIPMEARNLVDRALAA